jgi:hypothetical protein
MTLDHFGVWDLMRFLFSNRVPSLAGLGSLATLPRPYVWG